MSTCLILFHRFLKLSSPKNICCSTIFGQFTLLCVSGHWSILFPLVCYRFPLVYFSVQLLYFQLCNTVWYFLTFCLCWSFQCAHPFFLLIWWAFLCSTLNSFSGKILVFVSLRFLSGVLPVPSFGTCPFVFSFRVTSCVCFCVLSQTALTYLKGAALYRKWILPHNLALVVGYLSSSCSDCFRPMVSGPGAQWASPVVSFCTTGSGRCRRLKPYLSGCVSDTGRDSAVFLPLLSG